jgi:hypothetical protein
MADAELSDFPKIGLGLIGCGDVALRSYIPGLATVGELAQVVAVSDPVEARTAAAVKACETWCADVERVQRHGQSWILAEKQCHLSSNRGPIVHTSTTTSKAPAKRWTTAAPLSCSDVLPR